jgi:hypothetical protein
MFNVSGMRARLDLDFLFGAFFTHINSSTHYRPVGGEVTLTTLPMSMACDACDGNVFRLLVTDNNIW